MATINVIKLKRTSSVKTPTTSDIVSGEVAIGQPSSGNYGLYYHDGTNVKLVGDGIFVPTTRQISTSGGLSGGGALSSDLSLSTTGLLNSIHNLSSNGIIVRNGTSALVRSIQGTANQITVTNGDGVSGNPTISLPNDVTISTSLTVNGLTASRLLATDSSKKLASVSTLSSWIAGTTNRITVTDNGSGGVTLSAPQDLHTSANVQFASVTVSGNVTINGIPTNGTHAVTKAYVDNLTRGLKAKQSCRVATTDNINLSSPGSTIDGITMSNGNRVLVWKQTTLSQDGIYVWNGASSAMTRAEDANSWDELVAAFVFVEEGNTYADKAFYCTVDQGGTLGSSPVSWVQLADITVPDAGDGLYISNGAYHVGAGDGLSAGSDEIAVKLHTTKPALEIDSSSKGLKVKVDPTGGLAVSDTSGGLAIQEDLLSEILVTIGQAHDQNTDTGTTSQTFQIDSGNSGPVLKNASGALQITTSSGLAFTDLSISKLILNSTTKSGTIQFTGTSDQVTYTLDAPTGKTNLTLLTDYSVIDGGTY